MKDADAYLRDLERREVKELKRTHKRKYEKLEPVDKKSPKKGK